MSDKEEDKDKRLDKEMKVNMRRLNIDYGDEPVGDFASTFSENDFGLCYDCKCLYAFKTQYGTVRGKCYEFEVILDGVNKIMNCTRYDKKGQLSLDDMKTMAILIDDDKKTMGFI